MIRFLDILLSIIAIIILSPVFVIIPLLIVAESKGGFLFKQIRVGLNGRDFVLFKFRSMYANSDKGSLITIGNRDSRITKFGYFIRKYKIDELPQLFNVLMGCMSIVGPRPEVRKYVNLYTEEQRLILTVKPGITDYASIKYSNESNMIAEVDSPEEVYIEQILPAKIELNMMYIENKTVINYFKIILLTIAKIFRKDK